MNQEDIPDHKTTPQQVPSQLLPKPLIHFSPMSCKPETKEFNSTSYSSVVKLSHGMFNDWKLRLTTILGAQRLARHIIRDIEPPNKASALDDH